jgi:hypothetical protein
MPRAPAVVVPEAWDDTVSFFVNGVGVTVTNPDPTVKLVDFIRDVLLMKGTKVWACWDRFPVVLNFVLVSQ